MIARSDPRIADMDQTCATWRKGDRLQQQAAGLLSEMVTTLLSRRTPKRQRWGLRIDSIAPEDMTVRDRGYERYIQEGDVIARGSARNSGHTSICEMIMTAAHAAGLRSSIWRDTHQVPHVSLGG